MSAFKERFKPSEVPVIPSDFQEEQQRPDRRPVHPGYLLFKSQALIRFLVQPDRPTRLPRVKSELSDPRSSSSAGNLILSPHFDLHQFCSPLTVRMILRICGLLHRSVSSAPNCLLTTGATAARFFRPQPQGGGGQGSEMRGRGGRHRAGSVIGGSCGRQGAGRQGGGGGGQGGGGGGQAQPHPPPPPPQLLPPKKMASEAGSSATRASSTAELRIMTPEMFNAWNRDERTEADGV